MNEIERDLEVIKLRLRFLKEEGYKIARKDKEGVIREETVLYDSIHIPGGTSKDGEHYSGVFVYYCDFPRKEIFFCGLPYCSDFYKNEDDKNGHTKKRGETKEATAHRELFEETGIFISEDKLDLIHSFSVKNNLNPSKFHQKNFFMAKSLDGVINSFEGPNPIDGETAAPIWLPLKFFKEIFKGNNIALQKAIDKLMMDPECYSWLL